MKRLVGVIATAAVLLATRALQAQEAPVRLHPAERIDPDEPGLRPRVIPYHEGDPIPSGYRRTKRSNDALPIAGVLLFLGAYAVPALVVGTVDLAAEALAGHRDKELDPLFIPVAGPIITAAHFHARAGDWPIVILDSAAQAGGIGMIIAGAIYKEPVLVRDELAIRTIVPIATGTMTGLSLAGTF